MSAPRADRARRVPPASTGLLVAVLLGACAGSLVGAVAGAAPASAVWGAAAARPAAQLTSARLGVGFEVRTPTGTAPQASPYAVGSLLVGGPVLVDVVSTSSVPARVALVVTTGGVLGAEVSVHRCAVPWTGTSTTPTCSAPGGAVEVASTRVVTLASSASASWTADLPVGGRQHLRVSRGLAVASGTTLSATAGPASSGRDRTLG